MDTLEYILGLLARVSIKLSTSYMPQTIVNSQFSYTVLQMQILLKKKKKKRTPSLPWEVVLFKGQVGFVLENYF